MASTAASVPTRFWQRGDQEVSLGRLYAIRGMAVLGIYSLFQTVMRLVDHEPTERGMLIAIISGLWVMAFFILRHPLKMVPIILFEFVWKTLWLIFFGLPQWWSGVGSPRLSEDLFSIGFVGPVVFGLLIPWGYVWRHYVKEPADRWR